jgi:hypothetical protein
MDEYSALTPLGTIQQPIKRQPDTEGSYANFRQMHPGSDSPAAISRGVLLDGEFAT